MGADIFSVLLTFSLGGTRLFVGLAGTRWLGRDRHALPLVGHLFERRQVLSEQLIPGMGLALLVPPLEEAITLMELVPGARRPVDRPPTASSRCC
jgi:hypothetical protein